MPWKLFFAALAMRWMYDIFIFALLGDPGLQTPDSLTYLHQAHDFARQIPSDSLSGLQWLGAVGQAMPLFQWLIGVCALAFGSYAAISYVLVQGMIDAATCVLIWRLARSLDERFAAPAALAGIFNPTQIVLSGLVLADTPFLFFCTLFLLAAARFMRDHTWPGGVTIGLGLGAATMIRALTAPFAPVLLLFLLIAGISEKFPIARLVTRLGTAAAIFLLCLAPVLWRNVSQFGAWSLTPQGGIHLALWIVPLIKEARDGTPWQRSYDEMQRRVEDIYQSPPRDPFDESRRYQAVAGEQLATFRLGTIAKAWVVGAAINLAAPAIILSPLVSQLPRTGFYETSGASPWEKITTFLLHSGNATYGWILLAGILGVAVVRVTQLVGVFQLLRLGGDLPVLCLFGLWIAYVLVINGPVASPKYRLPMEAPLSVLTGVGLGMLRRRPMPKRQESGFKGSTPYGSISQADTTSSGSKFGRR